MPAMIKYALVCECVRARICMHWVVSACECIVCVRVPLNSASIRVYLLLVLRDVLVLTHRSECAVKLYS